MVKWSTHVGLVIAFFLLLTVVVCCVVYFDPYQQPLEPYMGKGGTHSSMVTSEEGTTQEVTIEPLLDKPKEKTKTQSSDEKWESSEQAKKKLRELEKRKTSSAADVLRDLQNTKGKTVDQTSQDTGTLKVK